MPVLYDTFNALICYIPAASTKESCTGLLLKVLAGKAAMQGRISPFPVLNLFFSNSVLWMATCFKVTSALECHSDWHHRIHIGGRSVASCLFVSLYSICESPCLRQHYPSFHCALPRPPPMSTPPLTTFSCSASMRVSPLPMAKVLPRLVRFQLLCCI